MKNTARNNQGDAIYDLHYNKQKNTLRVTDWHSKKTIVKVVNPTPDEVDYFINGCPTASDVKHTLLS